MISYKFKFISYYPLVFNLKYFKLVKNLTIFKINLINSCLLLLFILFFFGKKRGRVFIISRNSHVFTIVKAPMAHKRWSREQMFFKYYIVSFFFKTLNTFRFLKLTPATLFYRFNRLSKVFLSYNNNLLLLYKLNFIMKIDYKLLKSVMPVWWNW